MIIKVDLEKFLNINEELKKLTFRIFNNVDNDCNETSCYLDEINNFNCQTLDDNNQQFKKFLKNLIIIQSEFHSAKKTNVQDLNGKYIEAKEFINNDLKKNVSTQDENILLAIKTTFFTNLLFNLSRVILNSSEWFNVLNTVFLYKYPLYKKNAKIKQLILKDFFENCSFLYSKGWIDRDTFEVQCSIIYVELKKLIDNNSLQLRGTSKLENENIKIYEETLEKYALNIHELDISVACNFSVIHKKSILYEIDKVNLYYREPDEWLQKQMVKTSMDILNKNLHYLIKCHSGRDSSKITFSNFSKKDLPNECYVYKFLLNIVLDIFNPIKFRNSITHDVVLYDETFNNVYEFEKKILPCITPDTIFLILDNITLMTYIYTPNSNIKISNFYLKCFNIEYLFD